MNVSIPVYIYINISEPEVYIARKKIKEYAKNETIFVKVEKTATCYPLLSTRVHGYAHIIIYYT